MLYYLFLFFFFNDTATTEIYTLSLHDALPIYRRQRRDHQGRHLLPDDGEEAPARAGDRRAEPPAVRDRKSTRLNSSHSQISYAVFCLKKKKTYQASRDLPDALDGEHVGLVLYA